jgi:hypothetical protein
MQGGAGLSLDEIVTFNYQVALGDQTVTLAELQQLARLKAPLVHLRGQWGCMSAYAAVARFWTGRRVKAQPCRRAR